jgi:hypothetical protein
MKTAKQTVIVFLCLSSVAIPCQLAWGQSGACHVGGFSLEGKSLRGIVADPSNINVVYTWRSVPATDEGEDAAKRGKS